MASSAYASAYIRITRVVAPDELGTQLEQPMRNFANAVGRRMQRLVPKRTWTLHDSITVVSVERTGANVTATIGAGSAKAFYWDFVERGTSKQAAQPYMRPALLQSRAQDLKVEGPTPMTRGAKREHNAERRAQRKAEREQGGEE